jgi:hypothetical protein
MPSDFDAKFDTHEEFKSKIIEYVEQNQPCLYVLAPCYGSLCYVNFVQCLIDTKELCQYFNIPMHIEFCRGDSLISRARNNLVAKAMANPKTTHMIFIDNDITWNPTDVLKLMIFKKDIIGGVYPLKNYNWNRLLPNQYTNDHINTVLQKKNCSQLKDVISDVDTIQNSLLKFNVNYLSKELIIHQNLAQVRHIATGFMMFTRNVIETMSKHYASTKYTDDIDFLTDSENQYAYALFDCGVVDDHYLSEDWMFCNRWTTIGGSIWADVSIDLAHTGTADYKGSYITSLLTTSTNKVNSINHS